MVDFHAIAVGGGLAGASFALAAARSGLKVAVIERTRGPHQKVCGDFHSREAQELLACLGLDLARLGARPMRKFRLVSGRRVAEAMLPFTAAGFSRCRLDEELLAAAERAGVVVLRGESVIGLEARDGSVSVRTGARTLTARFAALATGKLNLRGWARAKGPLTAFKIAFEPAPAARSLMEGAVQLAGYSGGYAGACVVEDGSVPVCWTADAHLLRETGGDWRRQLDVISRSAPLVGDLLAGAKFLAAEPAAVSAIPFGYVRREAVAPNVYAVGDQLAVIPSFTGDGTSLALASGLRAAQAMAAGEPAQSFQRAWLSALRTQFLCARAVHATLGSGPLRALAVGAVAMAPGIATAIAAATRTRGVDRVLSAARTP